MESLHKGFSMESVAADTVDMVPDYGETSSLDKDLCIPENKGVVGLGVAPMKSRGLILHHKL